MGGVYFAKRTKHIGIHHAVGLPAAHADDRIACFEFGVTAFQDFTYRAANHHLTQGLGRRVAFAVVHAPAHVGVQAEKVMAHQHLPFELYGTKASVLVPDPNMFGGEVRTRAPGEKEWSLVETTYPYADANYRSLGVADMAHAILSGRAHRASGDLALHVLEVMESFETASRTAAPVAITSPVSRPEPISTSLKDGRIS